ncbi:hypothetical protein DW820_00660 [Streptococcus parasanguinis]|uniref:Uncharacterized protein n=1 Tax=Streptococcus parasanguinis TaxID=1318 RepID=A0A414CKW4_STRPA|nr:DUF6688 family protein [Streptococcus parasanguinis]RHC95676.1 hypothetical protein DW820_00660 [Streptococcus parasanguinis]
MKKLVSWYKKKDKELESHFTAGLLQINFVTNALILLAFYIYLVISQSIYALSDPFIQFSFWEIIAFTMKILPYGLTVALFVPNIFVIIYGIGRWSSLQFKEAEEEALKDPELFEDRGPVKGEELIEEDTFTIETSSPKPVKKKKQQPTIVLWFGLFGCFLEAIFIYIVKEMTFYDWSESLVNSQKHALIWSGAYPTFFTLAALTLLALIIYSYRDANSLSPLANIFCISGILGGVVLLLVFDNQLQVASFHTFFLLIYSFHLLWVRIKEWQQDRTEISYENRLLQWLHQLLNKSRNWPWLAVLVALPTLALVVLVLMLFGQQPDSMIKAWTNTADWAFSQKIPPQNLIIDEHYLCTVAAGGHENVVKPQRMGVRHGHPVVVNRQLCIANAFEQVLEEKTPRFHRFLRRNYDRYGYPFAKHIKKKWAMDLIYYLMKPLEWLFLLVLYLVDRKPENRIAMQYIKPIPEDFDPKKAS